MDACCAIAVHILPLGRAVRNLAGGVLSASKQEVVLAGEGAVVGGVELPEAVRRFLAGEAEVGVKRREVYQWMLTGFGEEGYRELVTQGLVARIADADSALESASDRVEVSKWREVAKFARQDFERRRPGLYGNKQEVPSVMLAPVFHVTVVEAQPREGRVIEVQAEEVRAIEVEKAG